MKSQKRLITLIIYLALFLTAATATAASTPEVPTFANDNVIISARPVGTDFEVGDSISVEIYIENPAAKSIGSITFLEVYFDSNVVEWDLPLGNITEYNRENPSTWPFAPGAVSNEQQLTLIAPEHITQNSARFSFDSAQNFDSSGALMTLNLKIRDDEPLAPTNVDLVWTASSNRLGAGVNCFFTSNSVDTKLQHGVINLADVLWAGVGMQNTEMIAGTNDSVTFPIMTNLIDAGNHPISVYGLPQGVTAPTSMTIDSGGIGVLSLTGSAASAAGLFDLTLSIAGATSSPFTLEIVARAIIVGSQRDSLIEGTSGAIIFPVVTENIPAGSHPITVQNLPDGVSIQEDMMVIDNDGIGTLTLIGTNVTTAGTHSNLILNIDDTASAPFTLTIRQASILPQEPPVNIQAVGTTVAEWYSGQGIFSWPQINNALTPSPRGVGRHYIAFNRTDIWPTSARIAIITITDEGITVRDGTAAGFEGNINLIPGDTNAKLLSYSDSTNLYVTWGDIPPGFVQLENNELLFN